LTPYEKVQRDIEFTARYQQAELDELVDRLVCNTVDEEDAECLIAFVPMAFAHEILAPLGVGLPSHFLIKDFDTGASARGRLNEEPIFMAARSMAGEMLIVPHTKQKAWDIAAFSAEMSVARELSQHDGSMKDIVLTEALLTRVPVGHLKRTRLGLRWRFWT
jgi:hypothetical protein